MQWLIQLGRECAGRGLPWHLNWGLLAAPSKLTLHATEPEAPAACYLPSLIGHQLD